MNATPDTIERHPLQPFLPHNARLLMLGSFPPAKKRWCMDFFYPNYINDMWRIFGLIFFNDKNHFVDTKRKAFRKEQIVSFLNEKGIAIYDTACAVRRTKNTASDKDLEVVEETDLGTLLSHIPHCADIAATGQKSTNIIATRFGLATPKTGSSVSFIHRDRAMRLWRMPSSSRAYPMSIEHKAESYKAMLRAVCAR